MRKFLGLFNFVVAASWPLRWELVRAWFFEQGFHMLNPYLFAIDSDWLWHWAPSIFFASLGIWLCYPRQSELPFWRLRIPLQEAAQRAYEEAKKAGVLDPTIESQAPETILHHFKMMFLVDDKTQLFGTKPPSTIPEHIPKSQILNDLYPVEGSLSQLERTLPEGGPVYMDVTVRRKDFRRVIKDYRADPEPGG